MNRIGALLIFMGMEMRRLQALVLCGGLGTRLRGHLGHGPKALAPIGDRPFLTLLLSRLMQGGILDVILCTGHGSEAIEAAYGDGSRIAMSLSYSIEHRQLGTAGALKHAEAAVRSNPFLLLNGDSLVELDLPGLLRAHRETSALVTMALVHVPDASRYGNVQLDARGAVIQFSEKPPESGASIPSRGSFINAGVYALDRRIFREIPNPRRAVSFEREILPALIGRGLFGYPTEGFFIDIGVPEDYERAQTEIPRRLASARAHSS
jgi:D-glycero-alpha-D-manno-heptose 1-phosphate guanylyltransferase